MKIVQISEFGDPSTLRLTEAKIPTPTPNQALIKVRACGVNPIDFKTRRGLGFVAEKVKTRMPWTPGYDIAGEIVEVNGAGLSFGPGDRVCGLVNFPLPAGGYSEYIALPTDNLVKIPAELSYVQAAALPLAGLTAWQGLFEVGALCAGQKVVILAAAGGVGHLAAQLAKSKSAYVWGTASKSHHDFLSSMGITPVDYHNPHELEKLRNMDFIFDAVGGETGLAALDFLSPKGALVTLPTISAPYICDAAKVQGKQASGYTVHPDPRRLQTLLTSAAKEKLHVEVQATFPLEQAAEAHRLLEGGHVRGKVVLTMND
ncbi:NADPH:quinone reductase and related Zn-dependent oxidoreductase [Hahella chejuensis KCTC 2396]|uniref:NADPH:quinone reductase and related Zn-dependent oxidoreductase n=1 Tax=Hahella chejuensis (strain KCTC 2396) TaxID=349521 RepID=Q2SQ40_HAHCH|nr:NADP-dependent oxidoreductase [Hahella chejuensis]ABC27234.1 NADPH:quinone reductase and related Zn-dependent oxidoreductase [Hahella chejuensis KCTC 2396]